MPVRRQSRSAAAVVAASLLLAVACGGVQTAVCGLSGYTTDIQDDLHALVALDAELVVQDGTPENAAALVALDSLEGTSAAAQATLDAATDDEVGPVVREAFQAVIDASEDSAADFRQAIESGNPNQVESAQEGAQLASDAIGAFQTVIDGLGIDCPGASGAPSEVPSASAAPSVAPTPVVTPVPTPVPPTASPEPTETPEPAETPEPEDTPSPTAVPTATPAPTPTATPTASPTPTATPSPSASQSQSASPEPSPSPSGEGDDQGGGLLPWIILLGLLGTGAAAVVLWYNQRNQPPSDTLGGPDDLEVPPTGPPTGPPPPGPPPPASPPPAAPPPGSPPAG
jgi:hypothetical protein